MTCVSSLKKQFLLCFFITGGTSILLSLPLALNFMCCQYLCEQSCNLQLKWLKMRTHTHTHTHTLASTGSGPKALIAIKRLMSTLEERRDFCGGSAQILITPFTRAHRLPDLTWSVFDPRFITCILVSADGWQQPRGEFLLLNLLCCRPTRLRDSTAWDTSPAAATTIRGRTETEQSPNWELTDWYLKKKGGYIKKYTFCSLVKS